MTKDIGIEYERPTKARRPSRIVSWMFDLMVPIVLTAVAVFVGRYGWPF